ncbi:Piso0_000266 [Millerozyma farinosa CBS 7064]|uniref:RING-type E3 ubiquitin transferase n=1 Tax=Pichia sorbitophila (strain ATCC MYA-4447 / BCRC 22081 / CBS 7064 / NBRC 10061 / NRRL Y-12695) TaxID=559304 RepID=G8YUZ3_PICSO|nr:Piso0_000266 [Millerozyma farinosa CBS 7064]
MSDTEKSCRVCRGEGTESQPLLHPCKCRGSIKYIHQNCLMEWLKHSNKSTKKCDICNTPYQFRTIYDQNMPKRIPVKLIWDKLLSIFLSTSVKTLSLFLYVTCLIVQVPLYWKFIGRIYTWVIDGSLPSANPTFIGALLFGELDLQQYDLPSDSAKRLIFQLRKFVDYTYFSGVRYILVCIIVHLALFVEHEWVIRDEGYTKLLLKNIGREPRTKLVDMLQEVLAGIRNEGEGGNVEANTNLQRLEMIARAVNDLQAQPANGHYEEMLRRAINEGEAGGRNNFADIRPEDQDTNENENSRSSDEEVEPEDEGRTIFVRQEAAVDSGVNDDTSRDENVDQNNQQHVDEGRDAAAAMRNNDNARGNVEQEERPDVGEVEDDNDNDPNDGAAGDLLEVLGINLNLSTPVSLMIMCDIAISIYLFIMYLIPHMLGSAFISFVGQLVRAGGIILEKWINIPDVLKDSLPKFVSNIDLKSSFPVAYFIINSFAELLFKTPARVVRHLILENDVTGLTLGERIISLSIGYSAISLSIYKIMNKLVSRQKPIMGTPRKIYKIFFEITSTAKVFLVFAIEIFFFPVYCGWLLDFCAAPLLLHQFITKTADGTEVFMFLFTSGYDVLQTHYLRIALYWILGTSYMLFFALFIGMVRGKILRPGVLFFIRSPDDPNARLIHDALVKPLRLQLSRIYLSAKVYTCFIIIGIGGVTWGLKYYLTPAGFKHNLVLPVQIPTFGSIVIMAVVVRDILSKKALISSYCLLYWKRAFEISTHKLRLTHFILGKSVPSERGYVVYRNTFRWLIGNSYPDFKQPVTYRTALQMFREDPSVNACFVPDGNYIRAPENDTISRRFIKKLFVPVTKDDQLLSDAGINHVDEDNENDSDSSSDEFNTDNSYVIVYAPPNFKLRCVALILMLWIFSVILLLGIIFTALLLGRPVVHTAAVASDFFKVSRGFFDVLNFTSQNSEFDWRLTDISSLFLGIKFILIALKFLDQKLRLTENGENEINMVQEEDNEARGVFVLGRGLLPRIGQGLSFTVLLYAWAPFLTYLWIFSVHKLCVDLPIRVYTGTPIHKVGNANEPSEVVMEILLTKTTFIIHLLVSIWTVFPYLFFFFRCLTRVEWNELELREYFWKKLFAKTLTNFGVIHLPATVFTLLRHRHHPLRTIRLSENDIYIWANMLALFILYNLVIGGRDLLNKVNEQVKNERYVRGRAIENIDIPDDE